jgi:hypothetical protein
MRTLGQGLHAKDLINYSSLARLIMKDLGIKNRRRS